MKINKQIMIDIFVFIMLFILCVSVYMLLPQFPDWDWANYKFYNGWSAFKDRYALDFLAANFRSYFNPFLDFLNIVLLFKLNKFPALFFAVTAVENAGLLFLVYKITNLIFENNSFKFKLAVNLFSIAYIITALTTILAVRFEINDSAIAFICMLGFYIFLKNILYSNEKTEQKAFLCGCVMGLAMGLKLTAFIYVITMFIIFCIFYKKFKPPVKIILLYITGCTFLYLLTNGYNMYKCYKYFQNPFFPYFNHIFQSPYADIINLRLIDYNHIKANSIFEYIFYFFLKSKLPVCYNFDTEAFDFRFPIAFITLWISAFLCFKTAVNKTQEFFNIKFDYFFTLLLFTIIPILINIYLFGTYRYILASINLFGLILFISVYCLFYRFKHSKILITVSLLACLFSAIYFSVYEGFEFIAKNFSELKNLYKNPPPRTELCNIQMI